MNIFYLQGQASTSASASNLLPQTQTGTLMHLARAAAALQRLERLTGPQRSGQDSVNQGSHQAEGDNAPGLLLIPRLEAIIRQCCTAGHFSAYNAGLARCVNIPHGELACG